MGEVIVPPVVVEALADRCEGLADDVARLFGSLQRSDWPLAAFVSLEADARSLRAIAGRLRALGGPR